MLINGRVLHRCDHNPGQLYVTSLVFTVFVDAQLNYATLTHPFWETATNSGIVGMLAACLPPMGDAG